MENGILEYTITACNATMLFLALICAVSAGNTPSITRTPSPTLTVNYSWPPAPNATVYPPFADYLRAGSPEAICFITFMAVMSLCCVGSCCINIGDAYRSGSCCRCVTAPATDLVIRDVETGKP